MSSFWGNLVHPFSSSRRMNVSHSLLSRVMIALSSLWYGSLNLNGRIPRDLRPADHILPWLVALQPAIEDRIVKPPESLCQKFCRFIL